MPTFDITLNVNVPGLGNRNVVQAGLVATTMEAAIVAAKANVVISTLIATQTATTP